MSGTFRGDFSRVEKAAKQALNPTSVAFAKAANQYVMKDDGALEASVWSASDFEDGKIVWDTAYAAINYHDLSRSVHTDKNPQAAHKWAEVAKSQDMDEVLRVAENAIREAL